MATFAGRATAAGTLAAVAGAIHLSLVDSHLGDEPLLAVAFLVNGIALLLIGCWVVVTRSPAVARVATVACLATVAAYVIEQAGVLPGHRHPLSVLGLAAVTIELVAAALAWPRRQDRRVVAGGTRAVVARAAAPVLAAMLAVPAAAVADGNETHPEGCVTANRTITLYAEELADGPDGRPRLGYGFTPATASTPGPVIELVEGDCVAVTLVNHVSEATLAELRSDPRWPGDPALPLGVSLHVHGVKYTTESDGTLHTGSFVPPGQARTYLWYAAPRTTVGGRVTSLGTAGYWWYHDHVAGTDHGTGGLASGLLGGVVVRRPTDVRPDRTYTVAMGGPSPLINFATFPDTFTCGRDNNRGSSSCLVAKKGELVEMIVIGVPGTVPSEDLHVFHLHGHNWADNRTGLLAGQTDETRLIDAKVIGPSESFGFKVRAGESVGLGDWMLHCHVQGHSDRQMVSFFRVVGADGSPAVPVVGTSGAHAHEAHDH